jgi:hypothetical protein
MYVCDDWRGCVPRVWCVRGDYNIYCGLTTACIVLF